jgi:hypothetical protein
MNSWTGEDIHLTVQGLRTITIKNVQKVCSPANQLAGRIRHNSMIGQFQKENEWYPIHCQDEAQFVVKATSRSPQRTSLADLGQIYISNKVEQSRSAKKRSTFDPYLEKHYKHESSRKSSTSGKKQDHRTHHIKSCADGQPSFFPKKHSPLSRKSDSGFANSHRNQKKDDNGCNDKIEPIIKINLHGNEQPEYKKAGLRFENMKSEILNKIIKSGEVDELEDILKEIKQAADGIICKHTPSFPALRTSRAFAVNSKLETQKTIPKSQLNQINEVEDEKTELIDIPPLKENSGSASSDGAGLKEYNFFKTDPIQISNGEVLLKKKSESNDSNCSSIKPIVLQEVNSINNDEIEREEQRLATKPLVEKYQK